MAGSVSGAHEATQVTGKVRINILTGRQPFAVYVRHSHGHEGNFSGNSEKHEKWCEQYCTGDCWALKTARVRGWQVAVREMVQSPVDQAGNRCAASGTRQVPGVMAAAVVGWAVEQEAWGWVAAVAAVMVEVVA